MLRDLISKKNAPCLRCPYWLGLVRTLVNPCPQCAANGYRMFQEFQKRAGSSPDGDGSGSRRQF